jgi:hypothetical protein
MKVNTTDASAIARHLFATQGAKAIAEAAQKAESFREAGDEAQASTWRRVEAALRELRGPHQS